MSSPTTIRILEITRTVSSPLKVRAVKGVDGSRLVLVGRDRDERGRGPFVRVADGGVEFGLHVAGGGAQVLEVEERRVEQVRRLRVAQGREHRGADVRYLLL